jgi:peptidoglycan/xylan/chitin deacetylase (PgdA/CDA1 family)
MRRSVLFASLAATIAIACGSSTAEDASDNPGSDDHDVVSRNVAGTDFGLVGKEIALTLDDGPGPRSVELARFLAQEKVPATFFMVGKNAKANPGAVQEIINLSNANGGLFIVANHSMTHQATPLPRLGVSGATKEIMDADAVLSQAIKDSQESLPGNSIAFFRPPYGAFASLGTSKIDQINASGASKYVGPVFWNIGGDMANGYSADWACWSHRVSTERCLDGYVAETQALNKGIVLMHDVHSKTVDMLMGGGTSNGRSFIKELRAAGYKFVSLRAHEDVLKRNGLLPDVADAPGDSGGSGELDDGENNSGTGVQCFSSTLHENVDENTCVQSARDNRWYRCVAGEWKPSTATDSACRQ